MLQGSSEPLLAKYNHVCAACGRTPKDTGFQQDHKVPRLRGGSDEISNWQPLCDECNNFKSTACRDCQLDCETCCWAYPEKFKPFHIPGELVKCLREHAQKLGRNSDELLTEIITNYIENQN